MYGLLQHRNRSPFCICSFCAAHVYILKSDTSYVRAITSVDILQITFFMKYMSSIEGKPYFKED